MSSLDDIAATLKSVLGEKPETITPTGSGIISESYFFNIGPKGYVIRTNTRRIDFDRDLYAYKNFSSPAIPVPEIISIGDFPDHKYYCISPRVPGKIIREFDPPVIQSLLPQVLTCLNSIHCHRNPLHTFGRWDGQGHADYPSWTAYLTHFTPEQIQKEKPLIEQINRLVGYCPDISCLLHGDYGFNNIVSDGKSITGVIDWGDAKYGDFLYDIAWLTFWTSSTPYPRLFKDYYDPSFFDMSHLTERLNCYMHHIAVDLRTYFLGRRDYKNYDWVLTKLHSSLI